MTVLVTGPTRASEGHTSNVLSKTEIAYVSLLLGSVMVRCACVTILLYFATQTEHKQAHKLLVTVFTDPRLTLRATETPWIDLDANDAPLVQWSAP